MKTNKEILDEFGQLVVENVYDDGVRYFYQILDGTTKWNSGEKYTEIFKKLPEKEKLIAKEYIHDLVSTSIFAFLKILEEHPQFKLYYQNNGQKANLIEISEMLKSEPIIENGWIARFSKELKK
jgi:hypothetical protein